jgi:hypothetical protein
MSSTLPTNGDKPCPDGAFLTMSGTCETCPDGTFLNAQTGACETFTTGAPPPALPVRTTWGLWQWAMLAGAIAGVGMLAHAGYRRHRQGKQVFPKFLPR